MKRTKPVVLIFEEIFTEDKSFSRLFVKTGVECHLLLRPMTAEQTKRTLQRYKEHIPNKIKKLHLGGIPTLLRPDFFLFPARLYEQAKIEANRYVDSMILVTLEEGLNFEKVGNFRVDYLESQVTYLYAYIEKQKIDESQAKGYTRTDSQDERVD